MKNRTLLLLMAFIYLTQTACKQRQFGYLSKVRVKQENVGFSNMTKVKTNLPTDTSLDHETLINVFAAQEPQSTYGTLFQGVRPKIGANTNSNLPIDTAKARLNTKESKKPKTIEPKNNTEADIAILLSIFHFISLMIFGFSGLALLNSPDDWASISSFFLIFGFGLIILYFAVKGLYYYFTHRKNKGLIFSSLAFIYASIIGGIFFYFLLYYLF